MALVTPYCTVAEATTYLPNSAKWENAEAADKTNALYWGRVFLDANYTCASFDEDAPPDEIKFANALLAEDYLDGNLIPTCGTPDENRIIKSKTVKAGPVTSTVTYEDGSKATPCGNRADVDMLLAGLCSYNRSNTVSLIRG